MTNYMRDLRLERKMSRHDMAEQLKRVDPNIDWARIKEFEDGECLPSPIVAKGIAGVLNVPLSEIWMRDDQVAIRSVYMAEKPILGIPFEVEDLLNALRPTPKSRALLCDELDVSDRMLRRLVEKARGYGYVIVNHGDGYYLSYSLADMKVFYAKERRRALTILRGLHGVRNWLRLLGEDV